MGCLPLVSCLLFIISCLLISLPLTCTAHLYPFSAFFILQASSCILPPASCFRYNACLIFPGPSSRERLFNFSRPCNLLFRCLFVHRGRDGWRVVDSGNLLANHAHWHRDSLKWGVCLCRSGHTYASVLSAYCLAYHPALYSWLGDRGIAGHLDLFQPVRSRYRTDAWYCHALV